ncbi:arsenosugar biosynthesis radical SAM (seleno)protein ArsS [Desulfitobacterium chlororespirans]|uniref:Radical SAM/Cys-rich domain-containing protein n=1 Tax=Desulfitobacterium chlororespirans DSM 11544 TaxID=1121395 RepID=A0A1M7SHM9_9FIRM|nr:arsenosugar biosynthesis radical SAM (seleno)protein ArsS [Desulfitobacterium chlororespirans]SHN57981.1 radical SAM/Cys-rich domain-containing protein [Desulfitobacterium chlororespirans DSM 11544]
MGLLQVTAPNSDSQLESLNSLKIKSFTERLEEAGVLPLKSKETIQTMQMNVGKICNLSCKHCHVEAGPLRTESMSQAVMAQGLQVMADHGIKTLDITGGAPELNPNFPWLIQEAKKLNRQVMTRTNLTVLDDEKYGWMPEFYAEHQVEVVSSLPYYTEKDADRMRGNGVFQSSIKLLKKLNELGYGREGSSLKLNLVYNPGGAFLPAAQQGIEADYRRVLLDQHGITFDSLFAIGNFPVGRFLTFLRNSGNLQRYMEQLAGAFNPSTVQNVMCRDMVSLSWDGYLYDCDFNQMLGLPDSPQHISTCRKEDLCQREIAVHNHCYACTAGSGSSCGGSVV